PALSGERSRDGSISRITLDPRLRGDDEGGVFASGVIAREREGLRLDVGVNPRKPPASRRERRSLWLAARIHDSANVNRPADHAPAPGSGFR
ncbi:hypothetical protein, partial [Klebsiella pneumoniae]|uniref:hypothetical protein n=1 Tax=Klebsiella pneumoniae TaxID=573 RepID=UPI0019531D55